jgi:hypothetical protein
MREIKNYSDEVKPLSKKEEAWMRKLEKVLMSCPPRLGLSTIGDAQLSVYDRIIAEKYDLELHDGLQESQGIYLGEVHSSVNIDGISG